MTTCMHCTLQHPSRITHLYFHSRCTSTGPRPRPPPRIASHRLASLFREHGEIAETLNHKVGDDVAWRVAEYLFPRGDSAHDEEGADAAVVSELDVGGEVVTDHESAFGVEVVSKRYQLRSFPAQGADYAICGRNYKMTRRQGNKKHEDKRDKWAGMLEMDDKKGPVWARVESTRLDPTRLTRR